MDNDSKGCYLACLLGPHLLTWYAKVLKSTSTFEFPTVIGRAVTGAVTSPLTPELEFSLLDLPPNHCEAVSWTLFSQSHPWLL